MLSQRFFIGNLPENTTEKEIKKAFQDYGDVTNVELKRKENLVNPGSLKVLAFVSLNLYDGNVDTCLRNVSGKQINGQYVTVSVAKESFLERLQREREENVKSTPSKVDNSSFAAPPENNLPQSAKSKKYFDADEDVEDDDDTDPILITKKRAAQSIRNGKIVIEGTNSAPIHVIGKQKDTKRMDQKSFDSDKKRKESVNKKKNQYQLQKSLIQKSLSSVDSLKTKKIVFEDNIEDNTTTADNSKPLFDNDSDAEEDESFMNDFNLKSEYEGTQGAALLQLQSRTNLDPRFKMDRKFLDKVNDTPMQTEESNERDWQLGILEQVSGTKLTIGLDSKNQGKKRLQMLRYDPSKDNNDLLIKSDKVQPMEQDDESTAPPTTTTEKTEVSKEVFYMVSDNLTTSLKTRGEGFSLLSMFGRASDADDKSLDVQSEKILISKNDKSGGLNPFRYDSSESENEQEVDAKKSNKEAVINGLQSSKAAAKLFVESFFIPRNDARLKEGKTFFRSREKTEQNENYDEVKDKLKAIINTKINKTRKQLKGTGKKKFGRGR